MTESALQDTHRPPYSNRGVYPSVDVGFSLTAVSGVDAYCTTVFANADVLYSDLARVMERAGLEPRQVTGEKVPYYARNLLLLDKQGHRLAQVRAGGANPHPFVECKGPASPLVCGFLRASYDHRPSRIDVALDRSGPGLFRRLHRLTRQIAKRYNLSWEPVGKGWGTPDAGRTIYLGSRQSQVFVRVYEKGLKHAIEHGVPITDELRNWVRIEVEFKPQNKSAKALARTIEPSAIWGTSAWLADFSREAFAMEAERVNISQRRESNQERALRFMASQYRVHLVELLRQCDGDLASFGAAIADLADIPHTH